MNIHDPLIDDHSLIRQLAEEIRNHDLQNVETLTQRLSRLQKTVTNHFAREDAYYRIVDAGKRFSDRSLIHDLRNDHAAVVFSLESLVIRLRRNGPTPEWRKKLDIMLDVLLPHLDREEKSLFPEGSRQLTTQDIETIEQEFKNYVV